MTDDLIKRLRAAHLPYGLHVEAADRIRELEVENERLRAVYDAAFRWWEDRVPKDDAEEALCHAMNNTAPDASAALAQIKGE